MEPDHMGPVDMVLLNHMDIERLVLPLQPVTGINGQLGQVSQDVRAKECPEIENVDVPMVLKVQATDVVEDRKKKGSLNQTLV